MTANVGTPKIIPTNPNIPPPNKIENTTQNADNPCRYCFYGKVFELRIWSDFAYEVNLKLLDGGGNSGIIFRTTNEGPGADNYYGYYFGISGTNFEIGKASNGWTSLRNENYEPPGGGGVARFLLRS